MRLDRKSLFFFSADNEKDAWRIIPGMLASSLSWGLSMTVHSFILGHLGTDATAAYSVVSVAQQLIQCLTQGISGGAGIILGQLLGANLLDKAKEYGKRYWKEPQSKKAAFPVRSSLLPQSSGFRMPAMRVQKKPLKFRFINSASTILTFT